MSDILLMGVGGGTLDVWTPASISNLGAWIDADFPAKVWQDTGATTPATISDTVALVQDRTANAANVSQGTAANEPTLVAWNADREALFIADSTDLMSGVTAHQNLTNGVSGITVCTVLEMPPVLTTQRHLYRITTNGGVNKLNLYQETNGKLYLLTRRVGADAASNLGDPATAMTGGARYVIIASVDYATGAGVIEVNGATTGLGITGTYGWVTGATCEALNPSAAPTWLGSATNPFTLGSGGELLIYTKALSAAERTQIYNYLNSKWNVV